MRLCEGSLPCSGAPGDEAAEPIAYCDECDEALCYGSSNDALVKLSADTPTICVHCADGTFDADAADCGDRGVVDESIGTP